jgi:hypothetical protein
MNMDEETSELVNKYHYLVIDGKKNFKNLILRINSLRNDIMQFSEELSAYPYYILDKLTHDQLVSSDCSNLGT